MEHYKVIGEKRLDAEVKHQGCQLIAPVGRVVYVVMHILILKVKIVLELNARDGMEAVNIAYYMMV